MMNNARELTNVEFGALVAVCQYFGYSVPDKSKVLGTIWKDQDHHGHFVYIMSDIDKDDENKIESKLHQMYNGFYFSGSFCCKRSEMTNEVFHNMPIDINGLASAILVVNPWCNFDFLTAQIHDYVYTKFYESK